MSLVRITRPDGGVDEVECNDAVLVHGIDEDGHYLGPVDEGDAFAVVPWGPPDHGGPYVWDGAGWKRSVPFDVLVVEALARIDSMAGAARLRYITDVPGQQATYTLKAEQARAYLAAGGSVPPFVQAEADALGVSAAVAATGIVTVADAWTNVLGPAIECARIRYKRQVEVASTEEQIQAAVQAANVALAAI